MYKAYFFIAGILAVISFYLFVQTSNISFLILFGLFTFSGFPLILSLAGDIVSENLIGFSNSVVWGLGITGGSVIGPIMVGFISSYINLSETLMILSILSILASLMMILYQNLEENPKSYYLVKVKSFNFEIII